VSLIQILIAFKMELGNIKRLTDRGFGFIAREGGQDDLFFHASELQGVEFNSLKEGDKVQFEVGQGPKGLNATKVSRA
jgi:CspA family cold shock protein